MIISRAFAGLVLLGLAATPAFAQQAKNIRGTIDAFDGSVLKVTTYEGAKVAISMPADVRVSTSKPFSLSDVTTGMKLGVTTVTRPADGAQIDLEIHPISATARDGLLCPRVLACIRGYSPSARRGIHGTARSAHR